MRIKLGIVAIAVTVGATSVVANPTDIIAMRRAIMAANGASAKVGVDMIRGTLPYDPAIAASVASTISHDAAVFPTLFPAGTEQGGDTKAKPELWANLADFQAISAKVAADAGAAATAAAQGPEAFRAAFGPVAQGCENCHEKYRRE